MRHIRRQILFVRKLSAPRIFGDGAVGIFLLRQLERRVVLIERCSVLLVWGSQGYALASPHILEKHRRRTEAIKTAFIISLCNIGIEAKCLGCARVAAIPGWL
jgi:hypothetical protein